jgi:hypothetical protein
MEKYKKDRSQPVFDKIKGAGPAACPTPINTKGNPVCGIAPAQNSHVLRFALRVTLCFTF